MSTKMAFKRQADKMSKDVVSLVKADHRKLEELFRTFETARTKMQRRELIMEIVTELAVHSVAEEKVVYTVMLREDEHLTQEAYEEHHVLQMILTELADCDGSEDNVKAKVKVLSEFVKHHVEEEEDQLLPKLKDSGADLHKLGQKFQTAKDKLLSKAHESGKKAKWQIAKATAKTDKTSLRKAS